MGIVLLFFRLGCFRCRFFSPQQAEFASHFEFNLGHHLGVLFKKFFHIFTALTQTLLAIGEPGAGLVNNVVRNSQVQQSNFSLSLQTIKFLQTAQQLNIHRLERLQMPIKAARETLHVLYRYSQHLLQRDIHSWRFVDNGYPLNEM